ncbi:MAG: queuosine precursor transporter [Candidatus Beckwithbacteria bacterium]|nr:queuosine precursor transporter [Candidatus Beckwithbacteria bacterium]
MDKTQKLDLLLAVYIAAIVSAELLGSKIFQIGFIKAAVGIFILPLTFTINDIVTEVYGKARARSFIKISLYILIGLAAYNLLCISLPPAKRFLPTNDAYNLIFAKSLRITLASLTAFFLSERFDVFVFSKIREKLGQKNLWLRNNLSNFIGQLFDTVIFYSLAFYAPGNIGFLVSLIWPYWFLKCSMSIIETPFTYLGVSWLKK